MPQQCQPRAGTLWNLAAFNGCREFGGDRGLIGVRRCAPRSGRVGEGAGARGLDCGADRGRSVAGAVPTLRGRGHGSLGRCGGLN